MPDTKDCFLTNSGKKVHINVDDLEKDIENLDDELADLDKFLADLNIWFLFMLIREYKEI